MFTNSLRYLAHSARLVPVLVIAAACSGCGNSGGASDPGGDDGGGSGAVVAAKAMDVMIESPAMDNSSGAATTQIAATVYIPEHREGARYPLILHSHGWGENRIAEADVNGPFDTTNFYSVAVDSQIKPLWNEGYAVISFDQRGFNGSGGAARVMDPEFETRDAIAVLDWAEAHLDLARDATGDPLVGAMGGSYGGGFQLLLAALDPRLDALTPSVTWYNLPDPLAPRGVLKKLWLVLLCEAGHLLMRTYSDDLTQLCQSAAELPNTRFLDEIDPVLVKFLADHGLGAFETRHRDPADTFRMRRVDALFTQGMRDTLFPLNEALANQRFLGPLGGDVRLITHQHGHRLNVQEAVSDGQPPLGAMRCGTLDTLQAMHSWFDEKLKGVAGAADGIPRVCISLDDEDGVAFDAVPVAGGDYTVSLPETTVLATQNNYDGSAPSFVPLAAAIAGEGLVLAGIPVASVTVTPVVPGTRVAAFLGIAVQSPGADPRLLGDQVTPLQAGEHAAVELTGAGAPLHVGDVVGVLLYGDFTDYNNAAKTAWADNNYTITGTVALPIVSRPAP